MFYTKSYIITILNFFEAAKKITLEKINSSLFFFMWFDHGRVTFMAKINSKKDKHQKMCLCFGGSMPIAQIWKVPNNKFLDLVFFQRQSVPVGPGWAPFRTLHYLRSLVGKEDFKQLKVRDFYPVDRTRPTGRCCVLRRCLQSAPKHGVAWYVYAATVCNCAKPRYWFRDSDVLAKPPCFLP